MYYETDMQVQQYLAFHYGDPNEYFPYDFGARHALGFPVRCVTENLMAIPEGARALDLGCAVGRSSFELACHCREVVGIDYSRAFIAAAERLRAAGVLHYTMPEEGRRGRECEARVPVDSARSRVSFEVGDAQNLRPDLGSFDVVIACNLICRLSRPMALLERLPELVKPGGTLVITTPFSWLEEFTPAEHWLGGQETGEDSFTGLKAALTPAFQPKRVHDMPMLIREHGRKFQYTVVQASVWERGG